jgi:hypothetical protein
MKNAVFWDVMPCGSCKNRNSEWTYRPHQGGKNRRARKNVFIRIVLRLLVTANVIHSSPVLVTLMMEAIRSSETSILARATRRNIREDGILHGHRRENFKSYIALTWWIL